MNEVMCEDCGKQLGTFTVEVDENGNEIDDQDAPAGTFKKVCRDCRTRY